MIASTLVVIIIAGALAMEFANNQMYVATIADRELLQEINFAMSHMQRELRKWAPGYQILIDTASNDIKVMNPTNGVLMARYYWDDSSDQLWYYPTGSGSYEVVSNRISSFSMSYSDLDGDEKISYFTVMIKAKGSWGTLLTKEIAVKEVFGARLFRGVVLRVT